MCVAAWAYVVAAALMGMTAVSTVQPADWNVPGVLRVTHGGCPFSHAAYQCADRRLTALVLVRRGDDRAADILDPGGLCIGVLPPHGGYAIPSGQPGELSLCSPERIHM